jgi:hypothetical protein
MMNGNGDNFQERQKRRVDCPDKATTWLLPPAQHMRTPARWSPPGVATVLILVYNGRKPQAYGQHLRRSQKITLFYVPAALC